VLLAAIWGASFLFMRLGAHEFHVLSSEADFEPLERRFDFMLNTVSADVDLNPYFPLLRRDGTMTLVGLPEKPHSIEAFSVVNGRHRLAGSAQGPRRPLPSI
jgi:uncharacterized zinc-type alcohol dehydrogenase-like protein